MIHRGKQRKHSICPLPILPTKHTLFVMPMVFFYASFLPLKKSKGSSKRSIGTMLNIIKYYQKPLLLKCKTVKQTLVDE
jgi:hypothetical protein